MLDCVTVSVVVVSTAEPAVDAHRALQREALPTDSHCSQSRRSLPRERRAKNELRRRSVYKLPSERALDGGSDDLRGAVAPPPTVDGVAAAGVDAEGAGTGTVVAI